MPSGIFGTRIMAGLTTLFNVLALNLAMIVGALPLITAPVAVSAASAALDQWRRDGEDRVIRQFVIEFRHRWSVRTTLGAGVPMAAAVLGLAEVRHFAREATLAGRAGLALGGGALLITLAAVGYVYQLEADEPGMFPVDLWSVSSRLAVRNLLVAGPLSAVPVAGVAILAGRDPAVLLLGLPLFLLQALKLIARPGLRRAAFARAADLQPDSRCLHAAFACAAGPLPVSCPLKLTVPDGPGSGKPGRPWPRMHCE